MMLDTPRFIAILVAIGALIGFFLWALRIVPAWAILVTAIGLPLGLVVAFFVFGMLAWMASGSH